MLRALPKLVKLDNVEVSPEEVNEALRSPIADNHQAPPQQKEEVYEEDYETAYRQQAAASAFRGHSPVREVQLTDNNKLTKLSLVRLLFIICFIICYEGLLMKFNFDNRI